MNKELLTKEEDRLTNLLSGTDPSTEAYSILLSNLDRLWWMINDGNKFTCVPKTVTDIKPDEVIIEPTPLAEPVPTPVVEKPKKEENKLTKDQVRSILADASGKGVKMMPLIAQFVPEGTDEKDIKFSKVPAKEYEALVNAVKEALKEVEANA